MSTPSIRIFHIIGNEASELAAVPYQLPDKGFLWLACARSYFSEIAGSLQLALQKFTGAPLVDLHVSDLLNAQLPSHYDYTSQYDLLVIRRLGHHARPGWHSSAHRGPAQRGGQTLPDAVHINTTPVGFVAWERVLLSVHPGRLARCAMPTPAACFSSPRPTAHLPPWMRPIWARSPTPHKSVWPARTRRSAPRQRRPCLAKAPCNRSACRRRPPIDDAHRQPHRRQLPRPAPRALAPSRPVAKRPAPRRASALPTGRP